MKPISNAITRSADELVASLKKFMKTLHLPKDNPVRQTAGRELYAKTCRFCNLYDLNRERRND